MSASLVALFSLQIPANAVAMPGVNVVTGGSVAATGKATSYWYASRPNINLTWHDRKDDGHPTHADGIFWAYAPQKNPVTGLTFYKWIQYDKKTTVNMNKRSTPSTVGVSSGRRAGATNHGSGYRVCVQYDWSPDACAGQNGPYGY